MRGGTDPTVTDANVVLGYFNPTALLGGKMAIDSEASHRVVADRVAAPLGIPVPEAAVAIYTIVNENMSNAVREIATEKGLDPRDFAFVCGGGCSPAHAAAIADSLGVRQVLVPRLSSVLCSFGAVVADVRHDYSASLAAPLERLDIAFAEAAYRELEAEAVNDLRGEGFDRDAIGLARTIDVRYSGEVGELTIQVPLGQPDTAQIRRDFDAEHERIYSFADPGSTCEVLALGVTGRGVRQAVLDHVDYWAQSDRMPDEAMVGLRTVHFEKGAYETPIYEGRHLAEGSRISGPAIVEEDVTTVVVPPDWTITLDARCIWILTRCVD
jgi:N-methylhydantoinase A